MRRVAGILVLVALAAGAWDQSDRHFRAAAEAHRRLGAPRLLAGVLEEWAGSLAGRDDPRASACLRERAQLAGTG